MFPRDFQPTSALDGVPWIKIGDTKSGSKYVKETEQKINKEGAKKFTNFYPWNSIDVISNELCYGSRRSTTLNFRDVPQRKITVSKVDQLRKDIDAIVAEIEGAEAQA
jgi:hypothetical protein